jgi:hypothetical protein
MTKGGGCVRLPASPESNGESSITRDAALLQVDDSSDAHGWMPGFPR